MGTKMGGGDFPAFGGQVPPTPNRPEFTEQTKYSERDISLACSEYREKRPPFKSIWMTPFPLQKFSANVVSGSLIVAIRRVYAYLHRQVLLHGNVT